MGGEALSSSVPTVKHGGGSSSAAGATRFREQRGREDDFGQIHKKSLKKACYRVHESGVTVHLSV